MKPAPSPMRVAEKCSTSAPAGIFPLPSIQRIMSSAVTFRVENSCSCAHANDVRMNAKGTLPGNLEKYATGVTPAAAATSARRLAHFLAAGLLKYPLAMTRASALASDPRKKMNQLQARLQRELTCAICHELLYKPVAATCGHSFCQARLAKSVRHSGDTASGPGARPGGAAPTEAAMVAGGCGKRIVGG